LAHAWWLARIAVALALFASQFPLAAAAQPVNEQAYAVRWIDEPITLDGRGDEPAWQNAKGVRWPAVAESDGGLLRQTIDAHPRTVVDHGAPRQAFLQQFYATQPGAL